MEGACAKIVEESSTKVRKVLKRFQAKESLPIREQVRVQQIARAVIEDNKLSTLMVPCVYEVDAKSYVMDRIDDSKPLYEVANPKAVLISDLKIFLQSMEQKGYSMNDIECYVQHDGRVAIIDFDKCEKVEQPKVQRKANAFLPFLLP
jgi:RIO-like serine/threonine protein kinase